MNTNLSIAERWMSDTPAFFKKAHLWGLTLVAIAISLAGIPALANVSLVIGVAGGTVAVLSNFAVKDTATLQAAPSVGEGMLKLLPDLVSQVSLVTDAVAGHGQSLKAISDSITVMATAAPPAAPVVQVSTEAPPASAAPVIETPSPAVPTLNLVDKPTI